jgi:uncharacterized protein with NRDE domain
MCLIFFSLRNHPTYKLVVAANRDEFYNRRTAAAEFWSDYPDLLGGRDLEAGGTWMGMTRSGRISLITNYRDPVNIDIHAPSRGLLVSDYLIGQESPGDYLTRISQNGKRYNGYNLIVGTIDELWYYSNYRDDVGEISTGLHGLSNHLLETPWPKVQKGKNKMNELLKQQTIQPDQLFELLFDDAVAQDDQLPDTGIGLSRERVLSSMFIKSPGYGTRCSTVILVDNKNHVHFSERVFDVTTFQYAESTFTFSIGD